MFCSCVLGSSEKEFSFLLKKTQKQSVSCNGSYAKLMNLLLHFVFLLFMFCGSHTFLHHDLHELMLRPQAGPSRELCPVAW